MKLRDILSMAFLNLWRRKLRAFLTVLGMVIGTASIVVMVSLGIGINQANREMLEGIGSLTTIDVQSWKETQHANGQYTSQEVTLDDKSVAAFQKIPGVAAVMPRVETWGMLKCGKYSTDLMLIAVDPEVAEQFGFKLEEGGRLPESGGSKIEMVLGAEVLNNFYDPNTYQPAIDMKTGESKIDLARARFQFTFDYGNIYTSNDMAFGEEGEEGTVTHGKMYRVEVVGQQTREGNNNSWYSLVNIKTLKKLAKENKDFTNIDFKKYNNIQVKCTSMEVVSDVKTAIEEMGYGTNSLQDSLEAMEKQTEQLRLLLGAIGGVALLVAAIGIMNTMMMSIYERTKEIGIIKVLGCRMGNIATLFLTEAAYIGFFGGALGLGVSYGLSFLLNKTLLVDSGMLSVIPFYLSAGALAFSVLVALISGMYPALRAMRLSALTAIRSE